MPLSFGGGSCWKNLRTLCRRCNQGKGVQQIDYRGAEHIEDADRRCACGWTLPPTVLPGKPEADLRREVVTDLFEQVRALNEDNGVVPAAPVVLAGAALEIALRSAIEELGLTVEGQPSIDAYAQAFRQADVLNNPDIKDVTEMAGLRNAAAYGNHEMLSRERASSM